MSSREQWVLLKTDCHNVGQWNPLSDSPVALMWLPSNYAAVLLLNSVSLPVEHPKLDEMLWDYSKEQLGWSKWDLRTNWYITKVLPPGQVPEHKGEVPAEVMAQYLSPEEISDS